MFDRDANYPTAVASYDDLGVAAAITWCLAHMEDGDTMSVWTSLKSYLRAAGAVIPVRALSSWPGRTWMASAIS